MNNLKRPGGTTVMLALALVTVIAAVLAAGWAASRFFPAIQLPVLAVVGVIGLFAAVTVVSVAFSIVGLSDATQALALPEGSVRAIIALALIVIFAITTIYLFGTMPTKCSSAAVTGATTDTAEQAKANAAAQQEQSKANAATQDFAKQLLVMLGTLITSVSSFYFGSSSTKSARGGTSASTPSITKIDPTNILIGSQDWPVTISGTNLQLVDEVTLVSGAAEIPATDVLSNANAIECKLTIRAGTATGPWDVVVSTTDGSTARLPGGLTVSPA
ncbi:MAG TPA: hypothetical protein VEZ11_18705, partial [Thermoanaerobaculia bacterium]|nr:hypothetical protein [Thermoanaerobaculia bacterium]